MSELAANSIVFAAVLAVFLMFVMAIKIKPV